MCIREPLKTEICACVRMWNYLRGSFRYNITLLFLQTWFLVNYFYNWYKFRYELCATLLLLYTNILTLGYQDISNQLTPLSSSFSHENKGGGQLLGVNWTFKNPTFSLSLSKIWSRKAKFSPLRGEFLPLKPSKNILKKHLSRRIFTSKTSLKKCRRFAAIFNFKTL